MSFIGTIVACAAAGTLGYGLVSGQLDLDAIGSGAAAKPAAASGPATAGVPANYLTLYRNAAGTCPHLDWALLVGVGWIESHHGQYKAPGVTSGANSAGAMGPLQFLAGTWREVRGRHPEIGPNVYNPAHAIPAAAHKLCDDGVRAGNVDQALLRYNPSGKYVRDVKATAAKYRKAGR